jgi:hypothetical protein
MWIQNIKIIKEIDITILCSNFSQFSTVRQYRTIRFIREGGVTSGAYAGPRAYGTYAGSCAGFSSGAGHRQGHGGGKNRVSED